MVRTRVGYCGGQKVNPTYHDLGDHTETLQLDFDPKQITYEQLLDIFWKTSNHCATPWGRQYMSAVFYADERQKQIAEATRDREQSRIGQKITTAILPLKAFYRAEDYHQKYLLRRDTELYAEVRRQFADDQGFVDSTVAARLNGYLGDHGKRDQLEREIGTFGLSDKARDSLLKSTRGRR